MNNHVTLKHKRELEWQEAVDSAYRYYETNRGHVSIKDTARHFGLNEIQLTEEFRKRGEE